MFGSNTGSTGFSFGQSTPQPGQQQQQQQQTGSLFGQTPQPVFGGGGGFGAGTSTTTPAFGQPAQQQQQQPSAGLFGAQPAASSGFGGFGTGSSSSTGTGAFGQPTAAAAQRPAFGSTGGVFGGQASTPASGTGLFGQPSSSGTTSAFGQPAATTSTFGQPQNAATGLFGRQQATTTGFGGGAPGAGVGGGGGSGLFGSASNASSAFGQPVGTQPPAAGTSQPAYQATSERDPTTNTVQNFQSITCMPAYKNFSFEELRLMDYQQGRKVANAAGSSGVFGTGTTFGTGQQQGNSLATPFGQSSTSSGFGQPAQQQQPSTGLFGQTASQPSTGLFGQSNTSAFGSNSNPFGQPAQTSNAFGTSAGTGLFGQPQQQQQQQNQSTGLFGSTQTAPSGGGLFGQPAASNPFGQSASSAPASGGLFGQSQQNKAPSAFGGFGQSNTSAPAFGQSTSSSGSVGGFGTSTPASTGGGGGGGGLFGQTSTASAPAFSFGQNNTPSAAGSGGLFGKPAGNTGLFGTPASSSSTGLFGQANQQGASSTQNKPLFGGFGSAPSAGQTTNNPTPSFAGFGATSASGTGGGGLFGNSTAMAPSNTTPAASGGLFGQSQQTSQPGFGLGSTSGAGTGLFGRANPAPNTGLFGTPSQAPAGTGLFGGTPNTGSAPSSLFNQKPSMGFNAGLGGLSGNAFGQNQQNQAPMQATIDQNAYGQNPLFNNPNQGQTLAVPIEQPQAKPAILPLINNRIGTPRSASRLRPRNLLAPASAASEGPVPWALSGTKPSSPLPAAALGGSNDKSSGLFPGQSNSSLLAANAFSPRTSVKKLIINRKVKDVDIVNGGSPRAESPFLSSQGKLAPSALKARVNFDHGIDLSETFGSAPSNAGSPLASRSMNKSLGPSTPSPSHFNVDFGTPLPNKTTPPVRRDGPVRKKAEPARGDYWIEPSAEELAQLDAEQLSNVEDFVVARQGYGKIVWKMPVDLNGLNFADIPGQVVQIEDRMTAVYEDDPHKPSRGEGLNVPARITLEGCWPLDKATREPIKDKDHPKIRHHITKLKTMNGTRFVDYDVESGQWTFDVEHFSRYGLANSDDEDSEDEQELIHDQASRDHPRKENGKDVDQAMKASTKTLPIFHLTNRALQRSDRVSATPPQAKSGASNGHMGSAKRDADVMEQIESGPKIPPKKTTIEYRRKYALPKCVGIHSSDSIAGGRNKSIIDSAIFLGRSCRAGWGPGAMLVKHDLRASAIMKLKHVAMYSPDNWQEMEALLQVQKAYTVIERNRGVPQASTAPSLRFHHFQEASEAATFTHLPIWALAHALFDEFDISLLAHSPDDVKQRIIQHERRQRLSDWLRKDVMAASARDGAEAAQRADQFGELFALISGNQLDAASELAMDQRNFRLATLIGQSATDEEAKNLLKEQLKTWRDLKVESLLDPNLRKIYHLLSGDTGLIEGLKAPDPVSSTTDLHIAQDLDWKRAFGLFLWYAATADDTIEGILSRYEKAFASDPKICPPLAEYNRLSKPIERVWVTDRESTRRNDIIYELIKIYCSPEHPLEQTIEPRNFGETPFDSTIGWHLQQVLTRSLGIRRFRDLNTTDRLTCSVAMLLERAGKLFWAIFVLLHLGNAGTTEKAVKDMIVRHLEELAADKTLQNALTEELKLPKEWLAFAFALRAREHNDIEDEITHLLAARAYSEAHQAIIFRYAPECILNNRIDTLERHLASLESAGLADWHKGGQIYQTYLALCQDGPRASALDVENFVRVLSILMIPPSLQGRAVIAHMASQAKRALGREQSEDRQENTTLFAGMSQIGLPDQDILALTRERAMIAIEAAMG